MGYTSTVPAALAGLVAVLTASPGLAGVEVSDGPPQEGSGALEAIGVGYSPEENVYAVEAQNTTADISGLTDQETYLIHNSLTVIQAGDGTADGKTAALVAARVRAFALLSAIGAALGADPTLRGAVDRARLADHNLRQDDADTGMLARINFSVSVNAWTS